MSVLHQKKNPNFFFIFEYSNNTSAKQYWESKESKCLLNLFIFPWVVGNTHVSTGTWLAACTHTYTSAYSLHYAFYFIMQLYPLWDPLSPAALIQKEFSNWPPHSRTLPRWANWFSYLPLSPRSQQSGTLWVSFPSQIFFMRSFVSISHCMSFR